MSEHAPDRIWSGIDVPKTIAGVLAAVTAAVIGSFLGAAGTLAGAAIASVVGSVGTEIYRKLVHRGQQKIVATFVTAPAAVGTPPVAAASDESPSEPSPSDPSSGHSSGLSSGLSSGETSDGAPRKMRWGRVAMVAASVFVLAIGVLTAFEAITGKDAADAVTGRSGGAGTTLGSVFHGDQKKSVPNRAPATTPSSSPSTSTPATSGSEAPATTEPTPTDTTTPSAPSTPTGTTTPEPTATDTQNSDGGGRGDQNNIAPPATTQSQETE
ncbi:hypothetical protein [Actinoplanes sp. NPDC051411]|uniref:hypothetical protein n=1 Tax=Actinoplanes sp. NPDC051411 TaxID=3155522 RepID=UPI00341CEF1C